MQVNSNTRNAAGDILDEYSLSDGLNLRYIQREFGSRFGFHTLSCVEKVDNFRFSECVGDKITSVVANYNLKDGPIYIECPKTADCVGFFAFMGDSLTVSQGRAVDALVNGDIYIVLPGNHFRLKSASNLKFWGYYIALDNNDKKRDVFWGNNNYDYIDFEEMYIRHLPSFVLSPGQSGIVQTMTNVFSAHAAPPLKDSALASSVVRESLRCVLYDFLAKSRAGFHSNSNQCDDSNLYSSTSELADLLLFIENNLGSNLNVDKMCEISGGWSRAKLTKKFISETGYPPAAYVRMRRLRFAKSILIMERGISIESVANRLKFANVARFSNYFEKMFGIRPADLKKVRR